MTGYLRLVDTDTSGPRYDVTPLFSDYEAFSALVEDLANHFRETHFDVVAGIDALGFILGTALAMRFQKGFVPVRKGGKLPTYTYAVDFVDYTGQNKSLELRQDAIKPGTRVLLADEWIETGAQVVSAIGLIEQQGGIIVGVASISIDENETTRSLMERYDCYSVWREP